MLRHAQDTEPCPASRMFRDARMRPHGTVGLRIAGRAILAARQ